ncbi:hypothetical protein J6590_069031 [Homalodisca vitripennis]|nr:hypothetical protein J6590_069031 [Homalodisca vitripennis]
MDMAQHDLPPNSPIQETIRVANAYISELCVRSEGVEISRNGRQFFTSHGQHLRESGKRLLTCLMIAHLATMAPDPRRHQPPLFTAPTAHCYVENRGGTEPRFSRTPKQLRILPFETIADAIKSTRHLQHDIILDKPFRETLTKFFRELINRPQNKLTDYK